MNSGRLIKFGARIAIAGVLLTPMAVSVSCSIYRNDRCYVDDTRYTPLRQIFIESGSVELVRRELERLQWSRCEKNEVLYRIKKEFEVPSE